jgi:GNAT superfamily N-acetyltransferase
MTEIRAADSAETIHWSAARAERVRTRLARFGRTDGWVDREVERTTRAQPAAPVEAYVIEDSGVDVGVIALAVAAQSSDPTASIVDIRIEPEHRGRGLGTYARRWAEEWAAGRASALFASYCPGDPATDALFASYPLRAQRMMKELRTPDPLPDGVEGRPMTDDEYAVWVEETIVGYAESIAGSGLMSIEDALAQARTQTAGLLPLGTRTPDHTFWSVHAEGCQVATNWLRHHYDPGTSFVFGVQSDTAYRGRGYGRAAMSVGEQASIDAGDTHLMLNVFGQNAVAINLYTTMGYAVVEQNRSVNL